MGNRLFDEVYKIEKDFFYVKNMHGVDWDANKKRYAALLPYVSNRADLSYLVNEMMSEMVVGHNYVSGGDIPSGPNVSTGLLGADYEIHNGKYRIKKIYTSERWYPTNKAPLGVPGINVKKAITFCAVNGGELTENVSIDQLLEGQVGRQVVLKVNSQPGESGAREITVEPVSIMDEMALRHSDWVEGNRRKVDQLSNGKIAYVYMLNTGQQGYTSFQPHVLRANRQEGAAAGRTFQRRRFCWRIT